MAKYVEQRIVITQDWNIAIVKASFNSDITDLLEESCRTKLSELGVSNVKTFTVPGAFELPLVSKVVASKETIDAVIVIGAVIRGGTPHFEYVCNGVTNGITSVNLEIQKPVIFGVLTLDTKQQALDRCGGKDGNKGEEFAVACLSTLEVLKSI
jgi:6,7-dimethyl-8-ribityllumazine synthase